MVLALIINCKWKNNIMFDKIMLEYKIGSFFWADRFGETFHQIHSIQTNRR